MKFVTKKFIRFASMTVREGKKFRCGRTIKLVTTPFFGSLIVHVFKTMSTIIKPDPFIVPIF